MNIDMNDMYIEDMNDVFGKLEAEEAPAAVKTEEPKKVETVDENDISDLMLDGGDDEETFNFNDIDDNEEVAEESDEESADDEEVEDEEEEYEEYEEETEGYEDGEEEVDFEEYDVTLPDGSTVKLNEAISGYKTAAQLQEERDAFEEERKSFESKSTNVKSLLELAKLEAQKVIDDYDDFDFVGLAKEDPTAYVENREFLDRYKSRLREINKEMEVIKTHEAEEAAATLQRQATEANTVLARDIPGWNKELYTDLMRYGHSIGMTEEYITSCVDPGVFKALFKARQLDEGKSVVKAKLKKIGTPRKVVKTTKSQPNVSGGKKAVLKKRIETGNFDDNDLGNMFNMLED